MKNPHATGATDCAPVPCCAAAHYSRTAATHRHTHTHNPFGRRRRARTVVKLFVGYVSTHARELRSERTDKIAPLFLFVVHSNNITRQPASQWGTKYAHWQLLLKYAHVRHTNTRTRICASLKLRWTKIDQIFMSVCMCIVLVQCMFAFHVLNMFVCISMNVGAMGESRIDESTASHLIYVPAHKSPNKHTQRHTNTHLYSCTTQLHSELNKQMHTDTRRRQPHALLMLLRGHLCLNCLSACGRRRAIISIHDTTY